MFPTKRSLHAKHQLCVGRFDRYRTDLGISIPLRNSVFELDVEYTTRSMSEDYRSPQTDGDEQRRHKATHMQRIYKLSCSPPDSRSPM